jgi:CheY-like chemotaxis protein
LESTALLVEALGYQAIRLSDPGEILETVKQEQPGLILQDLKMPGLNVAGLVAALRLNPLTAEVPLVFFSAGGDLPTTAARYDAWGYLAKPFGKEQLAGLLNQVLGAPADRIGPLQGRDMRREVRSVFRDYWNLLAGLNNHILTLDRAKGLSTEAQKSVHGLNELILKLESKTDRLSANIRAIADGMDTVPATAAPSPQGQPRSSKPVSL